MKSTFIQYLIATEWLPQAWKWSWALAAAATTWVITEASRGAWGDPWLAARFVGVLGLSAMLGWFASLVPAWLVFGPLLHSQGLANGAPFMPGDEVWILAGKHRGRLTRVYSAWQHDTVRVDLGDEEKAAYTDIFAPYHLLRAKVSLAADATGASES